MRRFDPFTICMAIALSAIALPLSVARADDPAPANAPDSAPAGATATEAPANGITKGQASLTMPIEEFRILLKPKTKAELQRLAEDWSRALEDTANQISLARIAARRESGDEATQRLLSLSHRQQVLGERLRLVLASLKAKGGDTADMQAYLDSVTSLDTLETSKVLIRRLTDWLVSEDGGIRWGLRLLAFVALLIAARVVASLSASVVQRALSISRLRLSPLLTTFFVNATRNLVTALGVMAALAILGVPVGPFLAALGAAGFIVGFALQDTMGNFAAGLMILIYRPFNVGDVVNVAGVTGKVQQLTLVSTTLLTGDNQLVVVPNRSIWGGIITNITGNKTRRVDLVFSISYHDDHARARSILESLLAEHPKVLKEPAPVVRVHQLGASSVDLICRPWVPTEDYWEVHWDLTKSVKEQFDAAGLTIPFPQQEIHLRTDAGALAAVANRPAT